MRRRTKYTALLISSITALLALTLAGCGGGSTSSSSSAAVGGGNSSSSIGGGSSSTASIAGVATPSTVAVVTATNAQ